MTDISACGGVICHIPRGEQIVRFSVTIARARLARLVFFKAIWSKTIRFRLDLLRSVVVTSTSYEILTFLFAALELRNKKQWPRKPSLYFLERALF